MTWRCLSSLEAINDVVLTAVYAEFGRKYKLASFSWFARGRAVQTDLHVLTD